MEWVTVPEDLLTHIHDWRAACRIALEFAAPASVDRDDKAYWQHQLDTLDKIEADILARVI